jgi:hypothetical protein
MIYDIRSFKTIYSCLFSDSETTKTFGHRAAWVAAVVGQLPAISPPAQRDGPAAAGLQHDHVKLLPAGGELLLPTLDWNHTARAVLSFSFLVWNENNDNDNYFLSLDVLQQQRKRKKSKIEIWLWK